MTTAMLLLALTFAIGIGSALTAPAWSAIVPELVPREDLVQAIALNGIGYNLTRAVGPALAGFLILLGGSSLAFSLYAVSIISVIAALFTWHRGRRFTGLPREHLLSAMRAGVRFVRNTPAVQFAMVRTIAFSIPASAPWALLPLLVRERLGPWAGHVWRDPRHDGHRRRHLRHAAAAGPRPARSRHDGGWLHAVLLRRHLPARRCRDIGCLPRSPCCCSASAGRPPTPPSRRRRSWSVRLGCGRAHCRSTNWRRMAR